MLKKIPESGDWIDPSQLASVASVFIGDQSYGHVAVSVSLNNGAVLTVECKKNGYIQANNIRDKIAGWVTETDTDRLHSYSAELEATNADLLEALRDTLAIAEIKWGNLDPDANTVFATARAAIEKATP